MGVIFDKSVRASAKSLFILPKSPTGADIPVVPVILVAIFTLLPTFITLFVTLFVTVKLEKFVPSLKTVSLFTVNVPVILVSFNDIGFKNSEFPFTVKSPPIDKSDSKFNTPSMFASLKTASPLKIVAPMFFKLFCIINSSAFVESDIILSKVAVFIFRFVTSKL